ncbi:electron transport complex subunit RsxB [Halomonas campisalis]|uniref:Electron transport complex subunit RsxB n=1 Tax=Billgrantia campisalis TaxID=74661 RepID=A0ABS9P525_9GAMM|nr:electron transport complex subunit RsxB [Halomonas campisalis]MCG6656175.1 electron transport complex subunit RsxB [Halomonas campisalis]MDR5861361.1 electron transport complex subunit RsxB [Halomonas campisalis]
MTGNPLLIEAIDALLPQTQCGKCGHPGCLPYAEAIAAGEAINRCPPGGQATVERLAELTGQPPLPLEQPAQPPLVAYVREAECIGCTKCLQACPVDAILGAAKRMHTVIADECTGCELCVAPCPVDCIDLLPHPHWQAAKTAAEQDAYLARRAAKGRERFAARNRRLAREQREKRRERQQRLIQQRSRASRTAGGTTTRRQRQIAVNAAEQALKRVQQQLESARRRGDAQAEATALAQMPEAEHLLASARQALEEVTLKQDDLNTEC